MSRGERQALVDRADPHLSIVRQCQLLKVARSTLYYQPAPVSDDDLAVMRRLSVAAGREQRNTRAVRDGRNEGRSLPIACQDGSRGVSTSYLITLLSARKKGGVCCKICS